jgi:hypothetical protein
MGLKRGTTFSIETSSYSKWIWNENSERLYDLNLTRILWNFILGLQIWMQLGPMTPVCT